MAKVQNPLLSQEAYGDLGGILFRRGTYGNICSRRSIASVSRTPSQTIARATFSLATSAWDALSVESKRAWEAYATYPTSGRAKYIGNWIRLAPTGLTPPDFPTKPPPTSLFNVKAYILPGPPSDVCYIIWDYTGSQDCFVRIPMLQTWSHRASPKPAKLKGSAWADVSWRTLTDTLPYEAPVLWVRVELVSYLTGDLLQSFLLEAERL